ncbi:MAG: hypothetical protein RL596_805 [Bacteroidota bacterium]|jgi:Trp operon repressor
MKKINFTCLSVALMAVSCSKESNEPFKELSALTKEAISKTTLQELKQAQAMLSPQEREDLWKTKLNFILANEMSL